MIDGEYYGEMNTRKVAPVLEKYQVLLKE